MKSKDIKQLVTMDEKANKILSMAVDGMKLSARSLHKIIKIAQTISDLAGSNCIIQDHMAEALQYRPKEREY